MAGGLGGVPAMSGSPMPIVSPIITPILSNWLSLAWMRVRARQLSLVSARFGGPSQRASRALRSAISALRSPKRKSPTPWAAAAGTKIRNARTEIQDRVILFLRSELHQGRGRNENKSVTDLILTDLILILDWERLRDSHLIPTACQGSPCPRLT
jgi:hypothetical protein